MPPAPLRPVRHRILLGLAGLLLASLWPARAACDEPPRVPLTTEERAWLEAHPEITFGPDPSWPPYEFFDEDGHFRGIAADHLRLVAERLGVTFRFVQKESWSAVVEAVKAREIDCYTTAVATPDRQQYMLFTRPHVTQPSVVLTRTDAPAIRGLQDLAGKKVAVVAGYWQEEELRREHPGIERVATPDIAGGLMMLSIGSVDAFVNDPATSAWAIRDLDITNVRIGARMPGTTRLAMGVRDDWPLLRDVLDRALASITPEELEAIERRWVRFDLGPDEAEFPWLLVGGLLAAILLVAGAAFAANRVLKTKVAAQTEQLRAELARREEVHRTVARTTVDVTGAAAQLAASAQTQARSAGTFQGSAGQAATAVRGIASSVEQLLEAVEALHRVARRTGARAAAGREQIERLDAVMQVMAEANRRMGERVSALQESARAIKLATVTMVKVVDQTNLLSVNSAIEAEKAREHGRGFRVVSDEIQRLADQSAEATLQIEAIVRDMRKGVAEGVKEAAEARERVEGGLEQAGRIGAELGAIMEEIRTLTGRFEQIRDLVSAQSTGTETIEACIQEVQGGAQAVSASSAQLGDVSQSLQRAVEQLRAGVSELECGPEGE